MLPDFTAAQAIMLDAVPRVRRRHSSWCARRGEPVLERSYRWRDPQTRLHPVDTTTLFDLASVSKLFVATTFMTSGRRPGVVALDRRSLA